MIRQILISAINIYTLINNHTTKHIINNIIDYIDNEVCTRKTKLIHLLRSIHFQSRTIAGYES